MLKQSLKELFSIKLIMSLNFKTLIIPFLLLTVSSCSRTKGYFSNDLSRNMVTIKEEPELLASHSKVLPSQTFLESPTQMLVIAPTNPSADLEINPAHAAVSKLNSKRDLRIKKKLYQKEVAQTIQKFKAQNKIAEKKSGAIHWEPRLKIGVTLLVIGIVLSIFGLGLIGGISAFVGLLFTILGLLNTYY